MSWIGPPSLSSRSDGSTRPPAQLITRSDGSVISSLSSLASPTRVQGLPTRVQTGLVRTDPLAVLARHLKKVNDLVFSVSDRRRFRPLTIPLLFATATKFWNVTVNYWSQALTEEEVEYMEEIGWLDESFEETAKKMFDFFRSRLGEEFLIKWLRKSGIDVRLLPETHMDAIDWAFVEVDKWLEERLRSRNDFVRIVNSINRKYKR